MSSTITQTLQKLSLVGQPPVVDQKSATEETQFKSKPLTLAGALTGYTQEQLTPAIGVSFSDVNLKLILELPEAERDSLIRDLAITISQNGVAFFKAQNDLTPPDLAELGLLLGTAVGKPHDSTLHIHPTQKLSETGLPVGTISSEASPDGRQISFPNIDRSTLSSSSWHSDVAFEPRPALYTILRMHSLPPSGGDTLWASAYKMYDLLSEPMAKLLEGLTAIHDAERFREQAKLNGFELRTEPRGSPLNAGDAFAAEHPVIRTNPTTGWKGLYVSQTFTKRIVGLSWDESDAILQYLFKLQHQSHDAHIKYKWSTNDVAIWDNRSTTHLATFDYKEYRAGDRVVCVGETPYLDPASRGRAASEAVAV